MCSRDWCSSMMIVAHALLIQLATLSGRRVSARAAELQCASAGGAAFVEEVCRALKKRPHTLKKRDPSVEGPAACVWKKQPHLLKKEPHSLKKGPHLFKKRAVVKEGAAFVEEGAAFVQEASRC